MDTGRISAGEIYSNYKTMCQLLDEPYHPTGGNAKKRQLETWSRFFEYEKAGIKFKILTIYDEPLPRIIRARNIKFTNIICHLLMMIISESESNVIVTTTNNLLRKLNMMSAPFQARLRNNTNLDDTAIDFVYSELKKKLNAALASLEKNNIIKLNTYNVKIIEGDEWKTEILTDEENDLLKQIENECIWSYQRSRNRKIFTDIQSIKLEYGLTEYMKTRNQHVIDLFGCRIMKEHHIEVMDKHAIYELDNDLMQLSRVGLSEILNQRVCDSLSDTLTSRTSNEYSPSYDRLNCVRVKIEDLININRIDQENVNYSTLPVTDNTSFEMYENKHKNKRKRKCLSDYD